MTKNLANNVKQFASLDFEVSESEMIDEIQMKMPFLPLKYLYENFAIERSDDSCYKLPNPWNLKINNEYWQSLTVNKSEFYIYKAYLDTRGKRNIVRATAKIFRHEKVMTKVWCQIWFKNEEKPLILKIRDYFKISFKGIYEFSWGQWAVL